MPGRSLTLPHPAYRELVNIIKSEVLTLALSSMKILEQSRNLTCFLPSAYCSSLSLIASMAEENLQSNRLLSYGYHHCCITPVVFDVLQHALGIITMHTVPS